MQVSGRGAVAVKVSGFIVEVGQSPLHPTNPDDSAVTVTLSPSSTMQLVTNGSPLHALNAELLSMLTLSLRFESTLTVTRATQTAVTVVSPSRVRSHAPFPEQPPPLQSLCRYPGAFWVDSSTAVPRPNREIQELPQSMPVGVLVTEPPKPGLRSTVRVAVWGGLGGVPSGGVTPFLRRLHLWPRLWPRFRFLHFFFAIWACPGDEVVADASPPVSETESARTIDAASQVEAEVRGSFR